jgi:hypothetical protein
MDINKAGSHNGSNSIDFLDPWTDFTHCAYHSAIYRYISKACWRTSSVN